MSYIFGVLLTIVGAFCFSTVICLLLVMKKINANPETIGEKSPEVLMKRGKRGSAVLGFIGFATISIGIALML